MKFLSFSLISSPSQSTFTAGLGQAGSAWSESSSHSSPSQMQRLWRTEHAMAHLTENSTLLSERFWRICQHPFSSPNVHSTFTLAKDSSLLKHKRWFLQDMVLSARDCLGRHYHQQGMDQSCDHWYQSLVQLGSALLQLYQKLYCILRLYVIHHPRITASKIHEKLFTINNSLNYEIILLVLAKIISFALYGCFDWDMTATDSTRNVQQTGVFCKCSL